MFEGGGPGAQARRLDRLRAVAPAAPRFSVIDGAENNKIKASQRETMKRITFVHRHYWPDAAASSRLLADLAADLAASGYAVQVVTARQVRQPEASDSERLRAEKERGVIIRRVPATGFSDDALVGRFLNYLSFYVTALWALLVHVKRGDLVVCTADPPMFCVGAVAAARVKRARVVAWLQALYPETASALGAISDTGLPFRWLVRLRNGCLRRCAHVVASGDDMAGHLLTEGVDDERMSVIVNWSDARSARVVSAADDALRSEWGLENAFVVGCIGDFGPAWELETLIGAIRRLAETGTVAGKDTAVRFLVVGGGLQYSRLVEAAARHDLRNLTFFPFQPGVAPELALAVPDIQFLSLKPELEGFVTPEALYPLLAAGRPLVFVGDAVGEVGRLVRNHRIGIAVEAGDAEGLAKAIQAYAGDRKRCMVEGERLRRLAETSFSLGAAGERWHGILEAL